MKVKMVECFDCRGTGAANPDCQVCFGVRDLKVRRAVALGYRKDDLEDVDDDGYCRCPHSACQGDNCALCGGDGMMREGQDQEEINRVLFYAMHQEIPPRSIYIGNGQWRREYDYLSNAAGAICVERGWISRFNSIFGHEVYDTPAGIDEAMRRGIPIPEPEPWLRTTDQFDRWADDGGRVHG